MLLDTKGKKKPIKDINYSGEVAKEIVRAIANALGFKIHENERGISAYGGNAIRISDHCTYMQTWVDNGTWNAPVRLDIVIEDNPTQPMMQVENNYNFTIAEFVHKSANISPQMARTIAYDIKQVLNGKPYANNTRGDKRQLISTHDNNNNSVEENKNRQYMKQTIKLKESELKRMIYESIKNVIKEGYSDALDDKTKKFAERYLGDKKFRDNVHSWENKKQVDHNNKHMTTPFAYGGYGHGRQGAPDVGYDERQISPFDDDEKIKLDDYADDYQSFANDYSAEPKDVDINDYDYLNAPKYVDYVYSDVKNESKLRKMIGECVRMALKGKRIV